MNEQLTTAAIFTIACLYSIVGHGGASGYLAVLSLSGVSPVQMSSTALTLNIIVALSATITYARAGFLDWRHAAPFIIASVPCALLGGYIHLPAKIYQVLLATVLAYSGWRVGFNPNKLLNSGSLERPSGVTASLVGGALGLLSGLVGIGGGIFLSPLMLLKRWAKPQETSAIAALFIVVNSMAGIGGRILSAQFTVLSNAPWLLAALLGGILGSNIGAKTLSREAICRVLAVVLMTAVCKSALEYTH
jgi:uncharacterized membrane protein YfcA